ncbi:hypothetical protein VMT65_12225 [Nocardia sp. CDC153]|uniref:hypothetical protein n=1 Tax=Nocardia sp. CDC153 TaxID=3112167 RepID=UPI002DB734C7|nr:hypothetical protein [Nocardia sp. CDC153]MEC3953797.1 hypothetical protein [Nocardia sp. CDC153]
MTDYLRPMTAYVATLGGHHGDLGRTRLSAPDMTADIPDTQGDTTADHAGNRTDRGRTR